ncbi:hydroxyacid dehydrogenase [Citreimonas salinaria]|uniref:D-lactate dehydrogenase n=1 Tax=Citreimonas salinaria TaxID=321339 RepID=A0A1H3KB83_9RHOB|nr:hydroxyacid dehydrogenase [Citreimonas salinaria]SDY48824.1 D-lactate dehydrogenase [Citreimonas salinaria]
MKIVIFDVEPWETEVFGTLEADHDLAFEEGPLDADSAEKHSDADVISAFIYSDHSSEVLRKFDDLKFVATRSTGFDHIDMDWCRENDVTVSNVPTYGKNTVAEHVFALLLAISHKVVEAVDRTRRGDFTQAGLQGFDLMGQTMGVIGTGDIGTHTARIARGFQMEVLAFDVNPRNDIADELGFSYVEMDELLQKSDIISLHVPGNEKTKGLIDKSAFGKMKDGAILINTARGPVVDTDALLEALSSGKLRAAGLDVLPEEPVVREEAELLRAYFSREHDLDTLLADHILLRLRNVVITPHTGFNTRQAVQRILDTTRENIEGFIVGKPPNVVSS